LRHRWFSQLSCFYMIRVKNSVKSDADSPATRTTPRVLGILAEPLTPERLVRAGALLGGPGGQRPKRARKLARRLAADGAPVNEELRALLDDQVSRAVNYGSLLLVVAILALMVFK
jgi:hypothetical protein